MTDRELDEREQAFQAALVAVMDYYRSLLDEERAKVARLERVLEQDRAAALRRAALS